MAILTAAFQKTWPWRKTPDERLQAGIEALDTRKVESALKDGEGADKSALLINLLPYPPQDPLHMPAFETIVGLLLQAGADPNARHGTFKFTPLEAAGTFCTARTVQLLLEAGADPLVTNSAGYYNSEHVGLLEHEAKKSLLQKAEQEALAKDPARGAEYADRRASRSAIDMLHHLHGSKPEEIAATFPAAFANRYVREAAADLLGNQAPLQDVHKLIKLGVDVNAPDVEGMPPLFSALRNQATRRLDLLLKAGARTDVADAKGNTLADYISQPDSDDCIRVLARYNIDLNAPAKSGDSALILAARRDLSDTVEALLAAGADIGATGKDGHNALQIATDNNASGYTIRPLEKALMRYQTARIEALEATVAALTAQLPAPAPAAKVEAESPARTPIAPAPKP